MRASAPAIVCFLCSGGDISCQGGVSGAAGAVALALGHALDELSYCSGQAGQAVLCGREANGCGVMVLGGVPVSFFSSILLSFVYQQCQSQCTCAAATALARHLYNTVSMQQYGTRSDSLYSLWYAAIVWDLVWDLWLGKCYWCCTCNWAWTDTLWVVWCHALAWGAHGL